MTTEEKKARFPYPEPGARKVWLQCEKKDGEEFWCPCDSIWRPKYSWTQGLNNDCGQVWRRAVDVPEGWEICPPDEWWPDQVEIKSLTYGCTEWSQHSWRDVQFKEAFRICNNPRNDFSIKSCAGFIRPIFTKSLECERNELLTKLSDEQFARTEITRKYHDECSNLKLKLATANLEVENLLLQLQAYRDSHRTPSNQSESLALKWMNKSLNLEQKLAMAERERDEAVKGADAMGCELTSANQKLTTAERERDEAKRWKEEDPRMLREQMRVGDIVFNRLNEECNKLRASLIPAEWIPVTERLPEEGSDVWVRAKWVDGDSTELFSGCDPKEWEIVTHWQPATIPAPPTPKLSEAEEAWNRWQFTFTSQKEAFVTAWNLSEIAKGTK